MFQLHKKKKLKRKRKEWGPKLLARFQQSMDVSQIQRRLIFFKFHFLGDFQWNSIGSSDGLRFLGKFFEVHSTCCVVIHRYDYRRPRKDSSIQDPARNNCVRIQMIVLRSYWNFVGQLELKFRIELELTTLTIASFFPVVVFLWSTQFLLLFLY